MGYYKSYLEPGPPSDVTGTPVQGGVEISWNQNGERDVIGYYVHRGEFWDDSLIVVSPLLSATRFLDTSSSLRGTESYRYAVSALTASHMRSPLSRTVLVSPLLPTSPPPPHNVHAFPLGNSIAVNWSDPREYDKTIIGYALYRATNADTLTLAGTLIGEPERTTYFDTTISAGNLYRYAVASIDAIGSVGIRSNSVDVRVGPALPAPPSSLHALPVSDGIRLVWDEPYDGTVVSVVISRRVLDGPVEKLTTVLVSEREFLDTTVTRGRVYYYTLSSINTAGLEGMKTAEVYALP